MKPKVTLELTAAQIQILRKALLQKWHRAVNAKDQAEASRVKSLIDLIAAREAV